MITRTRVARFLIWFAFLAYFVRFVYMRVNKPFSSNPLFPDAYVSGSTINTLSNIMNVAMLIALLAASLLAVFKYAGVKFSGITAVLVIVLAGFGLFWLLNLPSGMQLADAVNNSSISSMCFVIAFCIFIGYDDDIWPDVLKLVFILCAGFTVIALFETIRFVGQYGFSVRLLTSAAVYSITHAMLLMYVNVLLYKKSVGPYFVLTFIEIVTLTIIALVLQSRSWSAHGIILLVLFVFKVSNNFRQKLFVRISIFVLIVLLVLVFWNYLAIFTTSISGRLNSDSRSGQLQAFFSQVSLSDLFVGQGIDASYYVFGTQYQYLDNLILLTMFKYGFVPTALYVVLLVIPVVYGVLHRDSQVWKTVLFFVAWIACMLGFSIYVSYSITIYNIVAYLLIGRYIKYISDHKTVISD